MALKTQQQLIHYTDYTGIEPAIVFVHGYTCDETDWVNQVRHFGAVGQRVITLDLPGHGKSMDCIDNNLIMKGMGRNVVTLLHHLQVTRAIVVGHSMGTIIATEIAVQSPDVVIGIALIDGSRFARGDPEEADLSRWDSHDVLKTPSCPCFDPIQIRKKRSASSTVHVHSLELRRSKFYPLLFAGALQTLNTKYQYSQLKEVPVQVTFRWYNRPMEKMETSVFPLQPACTLNGIVNSRHVAWMQSLTL